MDIRNAVIPDDPVGVGDLEVPVRDDDRESLAFAERRGFSAFRREEGLVLDQVAIEPPLVEPHLLGTLA